MTFRIDAAWEKGKVYGFLLSFHTVDFVLCVRLLKYVEIFYENLLTKFQTVVEKMKVITLLFGISYT